MTQIATVDIVQNEFSAAPNYSIDPKPILLHSDVLNVPIERYERTSLLSSLVKNFDSVSEDSTNRIRSFLKEYAVEPDGGYGSLLFTKNLSDIEYSAITQIDEDINLTEKSEEYFELIFDTLKQLSFSKSDEYEDSLGGIVIDYFKDNERITCIVSSQRIQILSYIQGIFKEWISERIEINKRDIENYMENLFSVEKESKLDPTKSR